MFKNLCAAVAFLTSGSACWAQDGSNDATRQVIGLFLQTCIQSPGSADDVRRFLTQHHVPEIAPEGRALFLQGQAGVVFDASNRTTRLEQYPIYRICSSLKKRAICSVFGGNVDETRLSTALAANMRAKGLAVALVNPQADTPHSTTYAVTIKGRAFHILISVNPASGAGVRTALTLLPAQ